MTDKVFCYHCRSYHPAAEMTLVHSKGIKRWRCMKSIASSRGSTAQRDAFGKSVSAANRASSSRQATRPLPRPVLELLWRAPENRQALA